MKKIITTALTICLFVFGTQAQKLGDMEGALSGGDGGGNSDAGDALFWIDLFFDFGFYPTYGLLFGFEGEPHPGDIGFNQYPYADPEFGNYMPSDWGGKDMRLQITMHGQTNEDAVFGGFVQAKFSPIRFLTIDVNHLRLFETLEEDEGTDQLSITNFNLQVNRVRQPKLDLWWGGGLMLIERDLMYGSPSISGGLTWYFKQPLSLHAETQMGWPNGVFSRQNQIRVQYHLDRFAISAGYQGTKIGDVGVPNWTLGSSVYF